MAYSIKNVEYVDNLSDSNKISSNLSVTRVIDSSNGLSFDSVRKESGKGSSTLLNSDFSRLSQLSANRAQFGNDDIMLADSDSFLTFETYAAFIQRLLSLGFNHAAIPVLIDKFIAARQHRDVDSESLGTHTATESFRSARSIRRKEYREKCLAMHELPGFCYLAPLAWKERDEVSKLLGDRPTVEQVFDIYSDHFDKMRDITSFYVIKTSSDGLGSYHLSKSSHQSLGSLGGLINGMKQKWAARGSSAEKFSGLPQFVGHASITVPLKARLGIDDADDIQQTEFVPSFCLPASSTLPVEAGLQNAADKAQFVSVADLKKTDLSHWISKPEIFSLLQSFRSDLSSIAQTTVKLQQNVVTRVANVVTCPPLTFLLVQNCFQLRDVSWCDTSVALLLTRSIRVCQALINNASYMPDATFLSFGDWFITRRVKTGLSLIDFPRCSLHSCPGYSYLSTIDFSRHYDFVQALGRYPSVDQISAYSSVAKL